MHDFYFPVLVLVPDFEGDAVECGRFTLARRKWQTTIFDFATLGSSHRLHLPFQLMDVMMTMCNLELRISGCETHEEAMRVYKGIRLGMYAAGASPYMSPFITTHSVNDYSGINRRDGALAHDQLPDELREGLTTASGKLTAWPFEVSLMCMQLKDALFVDRHRFEVGCDLGQKWLNIVPGSKTLQAVEDAANAAPTLTDRGQSLLHVWTAIEALFPKVSTEVTFRLSLYLAQLIAPNHDRMAVHRTAKKGYSVRSEIAHGSRRDVTMEEWSAAWQLLMDAVLAIIERGKMPAEDELLAELLA